MPRMPKIRKEWILCAVFLAAAAWAVFSMVGGKPRPVLFTAAPSSGAVLFRGGEPGREPGQFDYPRGLAVDAEGNFYVADSRNHRIQVFRGEDGRFLRQIGSGGGTDAPGDLREPNAVAVLPGGDVAVADTWNHRVQVFSAKGRFKRRVVPEDGFFGPRGITASPDGTFYVADTGRHRVFHFDGEGKVLRVFGSKGGGKGEFHEPIGLALDPAGNLYVADRLNFRIQVFDPRGGYLKEYPVRGWDVEQVHMEPHLAVDARRGVLYATDGRGSRVLRLSLLSGESLGSLEKDEDGRPLFQVPLGIAVTSDGNLLVTDAGAGRVLKLKAPEK